MNLTSQKIISFLAIKYFDLDSHVIKCSHELNWFGSSYSGKALTFFNKAKRGAKKGGRVKNAEPAYIRGD